MSGETYEFGEFELDTARFQLRRVGAAVNVEPRAFDLLHHLVRHRDRVVPKTELLDSVWGDRFVSEAALTTALRTARRVLGDSGVAQRWIRTSHGRGYQFVGAVASGRPPGVVPAEPTPGPNPTPAPRHEQDIRFCRAHDGSRIAYASVGSGPPLFKAANWLSHLDLEWESPVWSHWWEGLARGRRLIRYDERGCGLSDWDVPSSSFDDWVNDLETVVDAIGLERFPLLGVSQGGAVAIAYAARHPERVTRLVLSGAYARGREVRASDPVEQAAAALDLDLARVGWAQQDPSFLRVFASQFLPDGTQQDWEDFTEFQRVTTSPENGVRFFEEFSRIDVSDIAGQVTCPTLILHSRGDLRVPTSQAAELATSIPDSRLVMLDSNNHLLTAAEPAWPAFLTQVESFLAPHVAD
ncbi:alpha/beta fold hydrolase [soil metagenome]